jgi:hypothetical protein
MPPARPHMAALIANDRVFQNTTSLPRLAAAIAARP